MTIQTRPDGLIFADSAKSGELISFPDITRGWGLTFDQTEGIPPMEWMNGIMHRQDQAIKYLLQQGIAEWSTGEDYPTDALVKYNNFCWKALQENKGNVPQDNSVYWVKFGNAYDKSESDLLFTPIGKRIMSSENLNSYQTDGFKFYVSSNADASAILNMPAANAGMLEVKHFVAGGSGFVSQEYVTYKNATFKRFGYKSGQNPVPDDGWSPWEEISTTGAGNLVAHFGKTPPKGTLVCNGGAVSRTTYAALFAVIGTIYGAGDGSTTFNLPNVADSMSILSAGTNVNGVGIVNDGDNIAHIHGVTIDPSGAHAHTIGFSGWRSGDSVDYSHSLNGNGAQKVTSWAENHFHYGRTTSTGNTKNYAYGMKLLTCITY